MWSPFNRRDFTRAALAGAAVGAAPAVARAGRIIGANDRVRIGCIGVGYRGVQVLNAFLTQKDAQIVALCDVYEPYLNGQFDKSQILPSNTVAKATVRVSGMHPVTVQLTVADGDDVKTSTSAQIGVTLP